MSPSDQLRRNAKVGYGVSLLALMVSLAGLVHGLHEWEPMFLLSSAMFLASAGLFAREASIQAGAADIIDRHRG